MLERRQKKTKIIKIVMFNSQESHQGRPQVSTVCLGWTNFFCLFSFFMPDLACYWKVWARAVYRPKRSLSLPISMELWHFECLEGGPETRNSAEHRRTLDLSILVFILFCAPRPPSSVRAHIFFGDRLGSQRSPRKNLNVSGLSAAWEIKSLLSVWGETIILAWVRDWSM